MAKTDKMFDKAAFGYRAEDVDNYIEELQFKIAALENENKTLQEKMQILADKINEYRSEESDLKVALVGAQKLGNSMIAEAKGKADEIVAEAQKKADLMIFEAQKKSDETINGIKKEADREKVRLARIQREVSEFKSRLLSIYKTHLNAITNLPDYEDTVEEEITVAADAPVVEEIPAAPVVEETAPAVEETPAEEAHPDEISTTVRFGKMTDAEEKAKSSFEQKYGDLRFGKNSN